MSHSARRLTATVLTAGALVAAAALPAAADSHVRPAQYSAVVLGAIQYDSPGRDTGSNRSLNDEWVTVSNTSRHTVNLRGWTLSDESRRTYRFNLSLAGRSSVRVHTGIGRDTSRDVYQDLRRYVWDNSDTATLRDQRGYRVDSKSWGRDYDDWGNGRDHDGRRHDGRDGRDHNGRDHNGRGHDDRGHGRNNDDRGHGRGHDEHGHNDGHNGRGHDDRGHGGRH
ncbi:lamin tail domain-containing protein [Streptomyces sp. NPDC058231]|uniref:lamin tail domain-containing protein n=1 Tax=Streptomyces sp. NPDC058231 TaxID=3346392 RepID=UPI0036EE3C95